VRWKADRQRKKKARLAKKAPDTGTSRKSSSR
jgi:hypothetical protein